MTRNNNSPKKSDTVTNKYCILIPARNESQVIEQLLISIEKQTKKINSKDVYIIVESKEDPTVEIVKKHNMNIIYRKDLTKKRKGYALDDAIKEILSKNKKYDAYFIFDADNILDKNYIKEMINSIEEGYDIGISYRNTKNSSTLVAASSALTFSMINTIGNQLKSKYTNNLTISGTGYYIKGSLVEDWQGFPFNTLTEDYELTLYSTLNNLTTTYNEKAIFYDEQPDSFKVSMKQRTRWVTSTITLVRPVAGSSVMCCAASISCAVLGSALNANGASTCCKVSAAVVWPQASRCSSMACRVCMCMPQSCGTRCGSTCGVSSWQPNTPPL